MSSISVSAFAAGDEGGNPCTIAEGRWSTEEMLALARRKGHECCLVSRPGDGRYGLRFFAPSGEMDMCAHASLSAAWLLCSPDSKPIRLTCKGGAFLGFRSPGGDVSISQPRGRTERVAPEPALVALDLGRGDLASGHQIVNAASTRTKTLVPMISAERLQSLDPDPENVRVACGVLGSTGLYPWALVGPGELEARQFPCAAGYREDPATGVAAAALFYALHEPVEGLVVHQGRALGRLSRIGVTRGIDGDSCVLSGRVRPLKGDEPAFMPA